MCKVLFRPEGKPADDLLIFDSRAWITGYPHGSHLIGSAQNTDNSSKLPSALPSDGRQ